MTNERMAEVLNAHADSIEKQPSAQLLSRTIEREMLIPALRHGAIALLSEFSPSPRPEPAAPVGKPELLRAPFDAPPRDEPDHSEITRCFNSFGDALVAAVVASIDSVRRAAPETPEPPKVSGWQERHRWPPFTHGRVVCQCGKVVAQCRCPRGCQVVGTVEKCDACQKCDCWKHERQVCDICQGTGGPDKSDPPTPATTAPQEPVPSGWRRWAWVDRDGCLSIMKANATRAEVSELGEPDERLIRVQISEVVAPTADAPTTAPAPSDVKQATKALDDEFGISYANSARYFAARDALILAVRQEWQLLDNCYEKRAVEAAAEIERLKAVIARAVPYGDEQRERAERAEAALVSRPSDVPAPRGFVDGVLYCYGGCGTKYRDFPCDTLLPTPLWNRIAIGPPFDHAQAGVDREGRGGVLCPSCIIRRLAALPECTAVFADIVPPVQAPEGRTLKDYWPQHDEGCPATICECGHSVGRDLYGAHFHAGYKPSAPCACGLDARLAVSHG